MIIEIRNYIVSYFGPFELTLFLTFFIVNDLRIKLVLGWCSLFAENMRIFCIVNFSHIIFSKSAGGNSFYSERSSPNFASNVK